ncbi:rhomboid-related protein 4-like [Ornithodoros turicata]|uniref:rhomboid-related protein 4-like n=1 Tax=Ornithodoros turicata TaxID=34597 RepID=UPI0031398B80
MPISKAMSFLSLPLTLIGCACLRTHRPVTLVTIFLVAWISMKLRSRDPVELTEKEPPALPEEFCISAWAVIREGHFINLLTAPLMHTPNTYVTYTIVSFARKAQALESRLGTIRFFWLLLTTALLCGSMQIFCDLVMAGLYDEGYTHNCSYGLLGVVFAFKTMNSAASNTPFRLRVRRASDSRATTIVLPDSALSWMELVLASYIAPPSTRSYHFTGVVAGTCIVFVSRFVARRGYVIWTV